MASARTLYEKLWDSHRVSDLADDESLIYIDRHLVHEVSSPQAFASLRASGRQLRRPLTHYAVADHAVPTRNREDRIEDPLARAQVAELESNVAEFAVPYAALQSSDQGIVHVIGPESGFTLPGTTIVCGDSHTTTHGAFGALAFGIGASECGTVMATQCLRQKKARTMLVELSGKPNLFVAAKDIALALIAQIGTNGASGYAVEYSGPAVSAMSMAERMTLCNLTIEAGSRIGLVAPDQTTLAFVKGRRLAPKGASWERAAAYWLDLATDEGARYDKHIQLDLDAVEPQVTWGTTPDQAISIGSLLPDPVAIADRSKHKQVRSALDYMGLESGKPITGTTISHVFIGSCTNGRIEDLRAAAAIAKGRSVMPQVKAIVVPGSGATLVQAEAEGLDRIFREAGFEWRKPGCSMCVAMNDDRLQPGDRCASTSNRNFEGRQGAGGRTHLMSPAMAAAAAVSGCITDVRKLAQ
ncbi:3-isopropylmalate dehydratase large subunit [Sphingorhabdus sp. YGSMI21]|uniref:3-isopropylmalate dehydratase large subunit n=1 Tax=Sphingorhabdus sp. YGSMI21 TaxID=2077182 RepID=UPI000C1F3536|nr:3-isopropylmalate dehydratase large subunit [Sphingorhabdus sp. YGSMI21]ATW05432.1 3-isopropylmalate dehydratase large subunit [Sphingorhabdus sp. YGSMI21]